MLEGLVGVGEPVGSSGSTVLKGLVSEQVGEYVGSCSTAILLVALVMAVGSHDSVGQHAGLSVVFLRQVGS